MPEHCGHFFGVRLDIIHPLYPILPFGQRVIPTGNAQLFREGQRMNIHPYRTGSRLDDSLPIFELDIEATQRYKLKAYHRKRVSLPNELVFASIDFNTQSLADVLYGIGYQDKQQTLFLWEGVTMYIEPQAVDSILAFIRSSAAEGSVVAFDYGAKTVRFGASIDEAEGKIIVDRIKERYGLTD